LWFILQERCTRIPCPKWRNFDIHSEMIFASCLHAPIIHSLKSTLTEVYQLDEVGSTLISEKLSLAPASLIEAFILQSALIRLTPAIEQTAMAVNSLDALLSAPKTHRLLFENAYVRILESRIEPGESVPLHTHLWDSISVILQGSRFVGIDHEGNMIEEKLEVGIERLKGDTSDSTLYTYTNVGPDSYHSIAFEIKK
jgi:hypothetical protein